MRLNDPWLLARAWVLAPLVIGLVTLGLGAGLGVLARRPLGALTAPAGYLAGMVVATALLKLGTDGDIVSWAIVALAVAGAAAWARARLGDATATGARRGLAGAGWPVLAALAAYGIAMAPLVGSGHSGTIGYVLNNDSAIHISVVELLRSVGGDFPVTPSRSSFMSVAALVDSGYPLGAYTWPLLSSQVVGIDAFHVWIPSIAVTIAMLALTSLALLRLGGAPLVPAALSAPFVACGYLVYSFHAQGSLKELATALAVYGTVALGITTLRGKLGWRALLAPTIAVAAAVAAFGVGAGAWLLPPIVVAGVPAVRWIRERRPSRRALGAVGAVFVLVLISATPTIADSLEFVQVSEKTLRNPHQWGNLLGPVPWREGLGIWLAGDYRLQPPDQQTLTDVLQVVAALLAVWGTVTALRRRSLALPLALASGACGALIISTRYSIYLDTKSYAVLAPALGLAVFAGAIALGQRWAWAGALAGVTMAGGVLASDAYVYSEAWPTPEQRFEELIAIDEQFAGQGPMLVNEREQYAMALLRRAGGWESWGTVFPSRGFRRGEVFPPPIPHTPDFDDYALAHYEHFPLLLERRRAGGSVPPSGYLVVHETPHYRVWRREGPLPREHLEAGTDHYTGVAPLDCGRRDLRELRDRARRAGVPVRVAVPTGPPPRIVHKASQWRDFEASPFPSPVDMLSRRGGFISTQPSLPAGRYVAWVQGSFAPGVRLYVDDRQIGEARADLGSPDAWQRLGEVSVDGGPVTVATTALRLPWWRTASRHREITGPVVFEPFEAGRELRDVPPDELQSLCEQPVDWIELPAA